MDKWERGDVEMLTRNGTSDVFICEEVFKDNVYRKLSVVEGDVVLDGGMNIGAFSVWALKKGAARVVGFEPDPDNYSLALRNVDLNRVADRHDGREAAITGRREKRRTFSLNVKKNKGAHSLYEKRGRDSITVDAVNINDVLDEVKPTVWKLDVEGGEAEIVPAVRSWAGIREFIMEFHHAHLDDKDHRIHFKLLDILERNFPFVVAPRETKKAWVTNVYASREPPT